MEWRRLLHNFCSRDAQHTLKEPLTAWIVKPDVYARKWEFLYSAQEDVIYRYTALDYSVHRKLRHDYDKHTEEFCDVLPDDALPIARRETPHTWIRPQFLPSQDTPSDTETPTTVETTVSLLSPWERLLLKGIVFLQSENAVWKALCDKQCFGASDGSAPKTKGSFAWILSNEAGERLVRCSGPVF